MTKVGISVVLFVGVVGFVLGAEEPHRKGTPVVKTHHEGVVKIHGKKLYIHCNLNDTGVAEEAMAEAEADPDISEEDLVEDDEYSDWEHIEWYNTTGGTETRLEPFGDYESKDYVRFVRGSLYLKTSAPNPEEALSGTFECRMGSKVQSFRSITPLKISRFEASYAVTEGEDLKIHCKVNDPKPDNFRLSWYIIENGKRQKIENSSVLLENGEEPHVLTLTKDKIPNAVLKIEDAVDSDRADYVCVGETEEETVAVTTLVRVKDKYAALWPFLGIVAEVIFLCVVILLCEKRRTDKEEEEEFAATANATTADNSNLRHRK